MVQLKIANTDPKGMENLFKELEELENKIIVFDPRWHTTWSYLKLIMIYASSVTNFKFLHQSFVPKEDKINTKDLKSVINFWLKHIKPITLVKYRLSDYSAWCFFRNIDHKIIDFRFYEYLIACNALNVFYYYDQIAYKPTELSTVYSTKDRSGHGYFHYQVKIFGEDFELCCLTDKHALLRVIIRIDSFKLTQELTCKLVTEMPEFDLDLSGSSTLTGTHVGFVYDFLIPEHLQYTSDQGKLLIGGKQFLEFITEQLKEISIPIEGASLIE